MSDIVFKMRGASEDEHLRQLGSANLGWLTKNLNRFSPMQEGRLTHRGVKAFAEFAVLYGYLEQWRNCSLAEELPLSQHLPVWREFLVKNCAGEPYAERARKYPARPRSFSFILPYLMLRASGYRSPYYEETWRRWQRWGYPEASETVPFRVLDLQHSLWKSGLLRCEPDWYSLYQGTTLSQNFSLSYADRDAAYSVTHTLFYLTDFGNRPLQFEPVEVERITSVVECLLVHNWRTAYWDLVGELLINLISLDRCESPFYRGAANAFQNAWRSDGAIPAEQGSEDELSSAVEPERSDLTFRACYHTTLIGVLYCATALKRLE